MKYRIKRDLDFIKNLDKISIRSKTNIVLPNFIVTGDEIEFYCDYHCDIEVLTTITMRVYGYIGICSPQMKSYILKKIA